ncbi:MAG TPA: putative sporulation protein YtxC [Symbiobacteriaceae bacterium]|nr:putative sporulation protein YtxC [Symbiobacteriaceae bacterium]
MQAITIGTAEGIEEIRQRLDDEFRFLQEEGVNIRIGQSNRGSFTFLDCSLDSDPGTPGQAGNLLRHYVASALTDVIVEQWEKELIRRTIKGTYYYFSRDEQDLIARYTGRNLAGSSGPVDNNQLYMVNRKAEILHRLRDYLETADELVLEGFVTFRLRDYIEEVEDAVDRAVDDFLMEREYREFVRLLKYFVDVQEPRMDHVHVLIRPGGSFKLVDDQGCAIKSEYLEEFVVEMVESEVNYEDLLISALITLAPKSVTVHADTVAERDESIETIKGVFGERVRMCYGCETCSVPLPMSGDSSQATLGH